MLNVKIVLRTPVTPGASGATATPTDLRSPLASEQPVTRLPPPASPSPSGGSTDPRTFLMLMAKQRRAEARARRAKRLGLLALSAAAVVVLLVQRHRRADEQAVVSPPVPAPAPIAESASAEPTPSMSPAPASVEQPAPALELPPAPPTPAAFEPPSAAIVPVTVTGGTSAEAMARCQDSFGQRLWKTAVAHCEQAYAAQPDAGVALRLAHSYFARGQVDRAGQWASRAVAEGTRDADAYVLIGHAERQAGNDEQAKRAYRQYLRTSPNGWHARNVRAVLRGLRARALSRVTPVYTPLSTTAAASSLSSRLSPR